MLMASHFTPCQRRSQFDGALDTKKETVDVAFGDNVDNGGLNGLGARWDD